MWAFLWTPHFQWDLLVSFLMVFLARIFIAERAEWGAVARAVTRRGLAPLRGEKEARESRHGQRKRGKPLAKPVSFSGKPPCVFWVSFLWHGCLFCCLGPHFQWPCDGQLRSFGSELPSAGNQAFDLLVVHSSFLRVPTGHSFPNWMFNQLRE